MGTLQGQYKRVPLLGMGIAFMHRGWVASPHYRAAIGVLRSARLSAGISQRQLAHSLGKPPYFVNKIELIERRIDVLEFIAIARAMGLPPTVMLQSMVEALPERFEI